MPYQKAYDLDLQNRDAMIYGICGTYVLSAMTFAVEHGMWGKKAKSEYLKEPVFSKKMREQEEEEREFTEEEKIKYQKQLLMRLQIMQSNFETSKIESRDNNEERE